MEFVNAAYIDYATHLVSFSGTSYFVVNVVITTVIADPQNFQVHLKLHIYCQDQQYSDSSCTLSIDFEY